MMLVRAAGRKLRRDAFTSPLCQRQRTPTTASFTPTAFESCSLRVASLLARNARLFATSADSPLVGSSKESPATNGSSSIWSTRVHETGLSEIKKWEADSPLIVRETLSTGSPTARSTGFGTGGDPLELHQNLYACLRVGRIDRATLILNRLTSLYVPSAPEMVDAHNVFLRTLLELAQQDPQSDSMQKIEQWYADNMLRLGVQPNADTFVTLLRAAISFTEGSAQEAALLHFLDMANESGPGVVDKINVSPDFTDEEWDIVIRMQPDSYEEPPAVEAVQDLHVNSPAAQRSLLDHGLSNNPTAPVRPVLQKGLGLDSLKQSLSSFETGAEVPYPHDMEGTKEEKDRAHAYARQLRVEQNAQEAAAERWKLEEDKRHEMGIHGVVKSKPVQSIMYDWYKALTPLLKKKIKRTTEVLANPSIQNRGDDAHSYGVWLERCKPDQLAGLVVARMIQGCVQTKRDDNASLKVSVMALAIGTDIEASFNADAVARRDAFLKKQRKQTRRELLEKLGKSQPTSTEEVETKDEYEPELENYAIPLVVRTQLGALCLEALMEAATITTTAPDPVTGEMLSLTQAAFNHQMAFNNGRKVGWIVPHHSIVKKLRNESVINIPSVRLPMLVEPKPWTGFSDGGYFIDPVKVVRQKTHDTAQRAYAQVAIRNGDMKQVLAGLDVLGKVPWKVNGEVLDVMIEAWNTGQGIAGIIPEVTDTKPPPEPPAEATYQERALWGKKMRLYENEVGGLHSQRCFQNFILEIARAYRTESQIYYPHSVDFRGRAYPIPPILNHMGADFSRGLLMFGNSKELGTVGLQWLKIHMANLYGFDKASLQQREQFAIDNLEEIFDSATKPLTGNRWWAKAEDPWQCLACCIELKKAFDLPDPTKYRSHLPVHQDGTCNGLQHYAALGGDHAGARQVNLEPSDKPQDIYTGVAELVTELVDTDAAEGNPYAQFIQGHISRKVVKRTVMTNVYGVTFMGAKEQVFSELKSIFPDFTPTKKVHALPQIALYVAHKIFQALGRIFNGAQDIQFWLNECGTRITTSLTPEQIQKLQDRHEGKELHLDEKYKQVTNGALTKKLNKTAEDFRTGIIWTTPLKMPVVQPYRKDSTQKIKTKIQDITVTKRTPIDSIDKRKQLQAFPPNFIHSLDATHMILSALKCAEENLDFAAVHDSFWTHPSDIPRLNVILRDAFVRMHSEDITGRLKAEFDARYAGHMYRAEVQASSTVAQKIVNWRLDNRTPEEKRSFHSNEASFQEVAIESRRLKLLKSKNPEEVAEGEAMETPVSIWNDYHDHKALVSNNVTLLGDAGAKDSTLSDEVKDRVLGAEEESMKDRLLEVANYSEDQAAEGEGKSEGAPQEQTSQRRAGNKKDTPCIQVWLPLTFPPVPKKGDWDVSRLRESKYFFS